MRLLSLHLSTTTLQFDKISVLHIPNMEKSVLCDVTELPVPDSGLENPRPECELAMTGELFSANTFQHIFSRTQAVLTLQRCELSFVNVQCTQ